MSEKPKIVLTKSLSQRISVMDHDTRESVIGCLGMTASELQSEAIKSGILFKKGQANPSFKRRIFVLVGQALYYYDVRDDRKAKGVIGPLRNFDIIDAGEDSKKQQHFFHLSPKIETPGIRTFILYTKSTEEKKEWMDTLIRTSTSVFPASKITVEIEKSLRAKNYEIPAEDIEFPPGLSSQVKKGASGVVRRGLWMKTTAVAVKTLHNSPEFTDVEEMNQFYKEIQTISQIRHPNIVAMIGYYKKDYQIGLITEWVNGGTLADWIESERPIDLRLKIQLALSIARGMVYLHSQSVIHRDLKPNNILVENLDHARLKVCDFGLSGFIKGRHEGQMTSNHYGTPQYAAPELPTSNHNEKVDVFSFAVIMWELCTRKRVWTGQMMQVANKVAKGERPELPKDNPLNGLIARCWASDPNDRPSFSEAYDELERIQIAISPDPHSSGGETPEEAILHSFGTRDSLTWEEFKKCLLKILGCQATTIDKIEFSLCMNTGTVERQKWLTFIKWFSPLYKVHYGYQDGGSIVQSEKQNGFNIDEIADFVAPSWFFGFLSAEQSQDILSEQEPGAYLFRFSSTPGWFTLSVNHGQVGHWRIQMQKENSQKPEFLIDHNVYTSLFDIIDCHKKGREPLPNKSNTELYLGEPLHRATVRL